MDDKVFSEKAAIVLVLLALIGGMVVGNLIGYDCGYDACSTDKYDAIQTITFYYNDSFTSTIPLKSEYNNYIYVYGEAYYILENEDSFIKYKISEFGLGIIEHNLIFEGAAP